jgi:hypothetical protein
MQHQQVRIATDVCAGNRQSMGSDKFGKSQERTSNRSETQVGSFQTRVFMSLQIKLKLGNLLFFLLDPIPYRRFAQSHQQFGGVRLNC